jgi:alpha-beta hydrolase superfamily lysophospholipase
MKSSEYSFEASDGKAIFVRKWLPSGSPKAILLVAHGMADHSARFERLAAAMAASGWAVYAPDHRGHGKTAAEGELGWMADRDGFSRVRDDLRGLALVAKAESEGAPLFLFGHSMGSVLAELYMAAYGQDLAGCVLTGVVAPMPPLVAAAGALIGAAGRAFKGQRAPARLLHSMSFAANNKDFEPARTPADWLSRDTGEVDKYVADPFCGFVCSFGLYRDFQAALTSLYGRPAPFAGVPKSLPVYLLSGAEDPVGGAHGFVPILAGKLKSAGLEDVETRLYPGARHEILNETNRDEVVKDIAEWLEARLAKARG